MAEPKLFLGVDGGASRCRARIRDKRGVNLGEAEGPAANIHVDFDGAIASILNTLDSAAAAGGIDPAALLTGAIGLGLAGLMTPEDSKRVESALAGFARVRAANDATTARIGSTNGGDGALIIAGTGSAAAVGFGGVERILGGHGFLAGDDGSAAKIGLDATRLALRAHDGLEPSSPLTREFLARHGDDAAQVVRWASQATPGDFGHLAPRVLALAGEGDAHAKDIVRRAAVAIMDLIDAVRRAGAERISLVGGLADSLLPWLDPPYRGLVNAPLYDAVDGAILMIGGAVSG